MVHVKMKKGITIVIILTLVIGIAYYKYGIFTPINYFQAKADIKNGKIQILTYGLEIYDSEELNEIALEYGFQFKRVEDCTVTDHFINQVDSYNLAVENYLNELNGDQWLERFDKEAENRMKFKRKDTP